MLTNEDGVKEAYFQLSRIVPDTMQATFAQVVADMGDSLIAATYNDATERFEQFDYAEIVVGDPDGGWVKVGAVPYTIPTRRSRSIVRSCFADGDSGGTYPGSVPFRPFDPSRQSIASTHRRAKACSRSRVVSAPRVAISRNRRVPANRQGLRNRLGWHHVVTDSSSAVHNYARR